MAVPTISGVTVTPAEAYLYEDFNVSCAFADTPDFAVAKIGSKMVEITDTSATFDAGTLATGTYTVNIYALKGADADSDSSGSVKVKENTIRDLVALLAGLIKSNLGSGFSAVRVSTKYNAKYKSPQVIIGRINAGQNVMHMGDNKRRHDENLYIDTWLVEPLSGDTSVKLSKYNLDKEVNRIINANKTDPWTNVRWMNITGSIPLDELETEAKVFRTRHSLRIIWFEDIS